MFGNRYYGTRYFGDRYFGLVPNGAVLAPSQAVNGGGWWHWPSQIKRKDEDLEDAVEVIESIVVDAQFNDRLISKIKKAKNLVKKTEILAYKALKDTATQEMILRLNIKRQEIIFLADQLRLIEEAEAEDELAAVILLLY